MLPHRAACCRRNGPPGELTFLCSAGDGTEDLSSLRLWVPIAIAATAVVVCVFYYYVLGALEQQGSSAFSIVNAVGLVVVIFGLIAAGIMLRRTTPP